jgi:protein-disulfide isomerase
MNKNGPNTIALSIIAAGLIIAGSIFMTQNPDGESNVALAPAGNNNNAAATASIDDLRLPDENSHIKGNPNARVTIVEFSDFECPFCGRIHPTLDRIISERDDVNWVYRHFPLSSIHSNAMNASIASECVAKLGGNDAFWSFADSLFLNQRNLGQTLYEGEAQKLGINLSDFRSCLEDDSIAQIVKDDLSEASSIGGRGTPFSVAITPKGKFIPFSGALPYESILQLVEQALES